MHGLPAEWSGASGFGVGGRCPRLCGLPQRHNPLPHERGRAWVGQQWADGTPGVHLVRHLCGQLLQIRHPLHVSDAGATGDCNKTVIERRCSRATHPKCVKQWWRRCRRCFGPYRCADWPPDWRRPGPSIAAPIRQSDRHRLPPLDGPDC